MPAAPEGLGADPRSRPKDVAAIAARRAARAAEITDRLDPEQARAVTTTAATLRSRRRRVGRPV